MAPQIKAAVVFLLLFATLDFDGFGNTRLARRTQYALVVVRIGLIIGTLLS